MITVELFDKAQRQLRRNVATARKRYQPTSGRYLLRTLIKCGECGLGMVGIRHLSPCKKYDYLYYECAGHAPLTVGRPTKCPATLVRAERLDAVIWQALEQLLQNPSMIPQLHQTWATAKQQTLSGLEAQQAQLRQRRQRLERQDQRLLDAYQAEIITLRELQMRRQKLAATLQQIEQESRQLAHTRQQSVQWQQVIDNATTFRQLLGTNLAQLSFEERQAIAQCLISKVVVTGEEVDVHFLLPFDSTPQVAQRLRQAPEGAPEHFYRLRLAHFDVIVATHKTIDLVFHTQVYKLKRDMTRKNSVSVSAITFMQYEVMEVNDETLVHSPATDGGRPAPGGASPQGAHDHSGTPGGQSWQSHSMRASRPISSTT